MSEPDNPPRPFPASNVRSAPTPSLVHKSPRSMLPTPLSNEAGKLLKAASASQDGAVLMSRVMGGPRVVVNNEEFGERGNPRDIAIWVGALEELVGLGLLQDRDGKGEVYFLTRDGYETSDRI